VTDRSLRFLSWTLEPRNGTLRRDGMPVPLQAQPAQLLTLLVQRAGTTVTRDEIRAQLWPDTVVEYDQSINYAIRQIRMALGPDAGLIQTVARRGYRFTGTVSDVRGGAFANVRLWLAAAAIVIVGFGSGFGTGVVARQGRVGQFVYDHLVHPDRCPYMQFLFPAHRNS
jgi:DNA-binding winged helix-turn-helix (wHTH) protein